MALNTWEQCRECQGLLPRPTASMRFCSDACKMRAYRKRVKKRGAGRSGVRVASKRSGTRRAGWKGVKGRQAGGVGRKGK